MNRLFLVAALATSMAFAPACSKEGEAEGSAATAASAAAWKAGDKVDVEWNGSYWKGEILSVNGAKYKVHYTGWSEKWDEEVEASRIRAPTEGAKTGTEEKADEKKADEKKADEDEADEADDKGGDGKKGKKKWKKGDDVDVEWNGSWWQATIMKAKKKKAKVHYVGWSKKWDELVTYDRVRDRTKDAKKGTEEK